MRLFELLMLLLILPVLAWPLLPWRRPRWVDFLPMAALLLLLLQLIFEGYRWQMLPAYLLTGLLFLITLPRLRQPSPPEKHYSAWKIAGGVVGLLIWLVALVLPYALPVPRLPDTTGPYATGTQTLHLVDESRDEIYTDDPGDRREIMVQLWYPTSDDAAGETAVYLEDLNVMAPVLAERLALPTFLLDHINLVELDTQKDVPILDGQGAYPLLVFSHGLRGMRAQNTAMIRELVSHGFVVAAIDHTYGNLMSVFPDGRVALYTPEIFSGTGDPPRNSNTLVKTWAADTAFLLDELATWAETGAHPIAAQLDLARVGIFGHSTGGGATVEFCGSDARCQAAVGLDPWLVPVSEMIAAAGLDQPFLLLRADRWDFEDGGPNFEIGDALLSSAGAEAYIATVEGAAHFDFTDIPLLSPLTPQLGLSSELDGAATVDMINKMTLDFFRQALLDDAVDLEAEAAVFPQIQLEQNKQ
jgi:predicted dienelactone hydrolase